MDEESIEELSDRTPNVPPGRLVGLIGPTGTSPLLHLACGLLRRGVA